MSHRCNYCTNKSECETCDKGWKDKFIPSDEVKQYFSRVYVGVGGIDGRVYTFNNTSEMLVPTHSILIDGDYYCPYCGKPMFCIQEKETLIIIGHCCICQGARDEIEYENKKRELEKKHKEELYSLQDEYKDKLTFCDKKLFETKQRIEKKHFDFFSPSHNHFCTLNDEKLYKIEQLIF